MESGFTKEQLQVKLDALKAFPEECLNFIGKQNRTLAIARITKKIENYK